jgi:hypothetical protein
VTKAEAHVAAATAILTSLGFVEDGVTDKTTVRVHSLKAPIISGIGGELRTFGGRSRYRLSARMSGLSTDVHATIGPRTVNLYVLRREGIEFLANYQTADLTREDVEAVLR